MCMLWAVLLQCSLLLQLAFNILFYPICTTFPPLLTPSRYQKNPWAFSQSASCSEQNKCLRWTHWDRSAPVKHLPEYTENTVPAKGLQVQFCPWEVGSRLRSHSWNHHNSATPQQDLPGCCCGRCCLRPQHICVVGWTTDWLCPRRIAANYPQWRTKPWVLLSLKTERCMAEPCFQHFLLGYLISWFCPTPPACGAIPHLLAWQWKGNQHRGLAWAWETIWSSSHHLSFF